MGRHAAPPPVRRSSPRSRDIPGTRTSTATAGFLVAGAGAALALVTALTVTLFGVSLAPRSAAEMAPASPSASPVPTVVVADTPAQQAIAATLAESPSAGWTAATELSWTGGTPFDTACGRPDTDAALAGTRIYGVGKRQVVVTVLAYSAGAGAVAFQQWSDALGSCASTYRYSVPAPTAGAVLATITAQAGRPAASAMFWRRGDVVVMVATPGTSSTGLASQAARIDGRLVGALAGRCASITSGTADAVRSPWIDGITFTGLTVQVPVSITPSPLPTDQVVSPVPLTWSAAPLPSASIPTRPADPVWPQDLPTPVASPSRPVAPSPAASVTAVPSRTDDPTGPGCGWAFAGMDHPPYDAGAEAAAAQALQAQAVGALSAGQQLYQNNVLQFWQLVPQYQQEAAAWTAYVNAVRTVASAWDSISTQRADYADAVAAYDAAAQARSDFLNQQSAAQAQYDADLSRCALLRASPTPTPTGTATPTPTTTDTATPTVSPSPTVVPGCPPAKPPILTQKPPTVPPVPTPPPDPRPSGSATR
jgi:hypothetical protein